MIEFAVNSLTLDGVPTLTVTQGGVSSVTSGSSMQFTSSSLQVPGLQVAS
jgi:hypothetical protein